MDELSESDLRQFTGDDVRYRHAFNRAAIYTEGVQFLAERGGAYWLIDEIAIHLGSSEFREAAARDQRIGLMHFWKLAAHADQSAELTARADSPNEPFIREQIPFTDFPLDEVDVWAANDAENWVLLLSSEY